MPWAQQTERIDGAIPQDPCVLAVASPLHGHYRPFRFSNANQSARNRFPRLAGIEHVGAQYHAARVETSVVPHRRHGQSDLLLRHIFVRAGPQLLGKLALFGIQKFRPKHRFHPPRGECRFHDHLVEMVEHPIECVLLPAPPSSDGGEFELLFQQLCGEAWKKGHDRSRLNQPASQGIGYLHISRNDGVDEARHSQKRVGSQFERIAETIVHPTQNHIDLFQPVNGFEIHASFAHRQVRPLH